MKRLFSLLLLLPLSVSAGSWQADSTEHQMAVLELFTSEGCGLCPPAEYWVNSLPQQGIADDRLIVLNFHVDYLDDKKGWVDQFARPEFSERQRQLARLNLFDSVYTPQFVLSGEVVHNWRQHLHEVVHFINDFQPEADIRLQVEQQGQQLLIDSHVLVHGEHNQQHASLFLAIKEDDLFSEISGGDNAGRSFNHQKVVRSWLGPFQLAPEMLVSATVQIPEGWQRDKLSVVAVVQNLDNAFVIQGLALPLED